MQILITGGAGFIGSYLTAELLAQGHEVQILDDLSTGRAESFEAFKSNSGFSYVIDSVTNEAVVDKLIDGVDCIYHLAAAVGVRLIIDNPVSSIETNVLGTEIILRAAARARAPIFIASSSEVYGKTLSVPFNENDNLALGATNNTRWSYACSKAIDECLALAYHREQNLPVVIGRLFNTTGPGQASQYGMVLPNFVGQAISGQPITVFGDGSQTRCFCHVRDTVRALIDLMADPACEGQVFNIGSSHEVSITELARQVRDQTRSASVIETIPYNEAYGSGFEDMQRRVPDTGKIERQIGWRPEISLEQLVQDVVDDMRAKQS